MKTDCDSFRGTWCRALKTLYCKHDDCSFYISARDAEKARQRTNNKLTAMPSGQQRRIAEKYYSGERPWLAGKHGYWE